MTAGALPADPAVAAASGAAAGDVPAAGPFREWRFEGRAMASPLQLVVRGSPEHERIAATAWEQVVAIFEAAEQALSRFRESSDLTALNRAAGRPVEPRSRLLVKALAAADRAHRRTGGRFDPRVLADLDRLGYAGAPLPGGDMSGVVARGTGPSDRSATTGPSAGAGRVVPSGASRGPFRLVQRTGRRGPVTIQSPLDLGGIGKGLALRWAANGTVPVLRRVLDGAGGFLIDAGHDIAARGDGPAEGGAWLLDIEDPTGKLESLAVIRLPRGGSVATSSIRRRQWTSPDGRAAHHLIDPRTGEPGGSGLLAVTVAGADPAWAEVWSKTLFLAGAGGIGHAARREGLAAWWVTGDGSLEMTPAARPATLWLAGEQPAGRS